MIEFASPSINGAVLKNLMGWGVLFAPGVVKNKNNLKNNNYFISSFNLGIKIFKIHTLVFIPKMF